jgi:hypothetical protein
VNGQAEGRKDRTRLGERHGAAARDLQQCRSVEAAEHDAEASVERHLAEHLRRWHAGGEDCLGHPRLLLAEPRRETFLEQFYDLTWRPGVDVRRAALVDLLPEGSPHRPSPVFPPVATKHQRRAKENAPAILAASHDRGLSPAAAFARIAKRRGLRQVRLWHP